MGKQSTFKALFEIFLVFLKIGPVTFGGGFAMIPVIEKEIVERKKWMDSSEITDILAVAQAIPGAVAMNSAMLVGYRLAGVAGAITALFGVLLPTFLIVLLLSLFFMQIRHNPKIEAAFVSIRATVVAIIVYAALKIGRTAAIDKTTSAMIVISVGALYFLGIHPIWMIVAGGGVGIAAIRLKQRLHLPVALEKSKDSYFKYRDHYYGEGI